MTVELGGDVWEDVCPLEDRTLSEEHRHILEVESGIDPEIIDSRGYYSMTRAQVTELVNLEVLHGHALRATGWMGIPIWRPDSEKHGEIIRMFGAPGKAKYLWPTGKRLAFDVHPDCLPLLLDTDIPILMTEGTKKADAILSAARREGMQVAVIALSGYNGWRVKIGGKSIATPDYQDIAWEDRKCYVISDSDYRTNDEVAKGWSACAVYTGSKTGPHRTMLIVVPPDGSAKQGADDYLAKGNTLDSLLGYAQSPRHTTIEDDDERVPLQLKSGMQLMRESGGKIPHLMEPMIPENSIMLVAGHSGTYKTWLMLSLALDAAFGLPWLDHPGFSITAPFNTLYVNKEMASRIMGQRLFYLAHNERYTKYPDWEKTIEDRVTSVDEPALDLNVAAQRARLEDAIMLSGAKLVVLDSLSMSWHGDENSSTEVGMFYSELRGITERTGVTWAIVHHLLKPTSGHLKRGDPLTASIRGSGQLAQQADAALMVGHYLSEVQDEDARPIVLTHAKARTGEELPAWITSFEMHDGMYASMLHLCTVKDAKARNYAQSEGNPDKLSDWLLEEFKAMPGMSPTGTGMRFRTLVTLLQSAWTVPGEQPPSDSTIRRRMTEMANAGQIELVDTSKTTGDLYRLKEMSDDDERSEEPPAPPRPRLSLPASAVLSRRSARRADPDNAQLQVE